MTIARELVTKLGFSFDRTNLDKFENAIVGFKTKVAVGVGIIGVAFKKVIDYADEFSNKILNTKAIAKFTDTSIQDLDALQSAFNKLNVPDDVFNSFASKLAIGIKEASRGVNNSFRQLVDQSNGAVRLRINNEVVTVKQAVDDIFEYLKNIEKESEKLRITQNIFGVDLATTDAIVQIAKLTKDEFQKIVEQEKQSLELLNSQVKAAQEFKNQINEMNTEWSKFSAKIAETAVPIITAALAGNTLITEKVQGEGVVSTLSFLRDAIENVFAGLNGEDHITRVKREIQSEDEDFRRRVSEFNGQGANSNASITNNNKFEFNVPPGTTEQQANFLTETVKTTMSSFWDEKVREVINNNPQVE